MADELSTLVVKIQADVADLKSKFEEAANTVKGHTESMASAIASFTDSSSKHFLDFGQIAETALGVLGGELVMKGIEMLGEKLRELFGELKEGVQLASQQEGSIIRLNFALAAAGQYSEEAAKGMLEFAESLENHSNYSKNAILETSALLETLGKLDEAGLKKATQGTVDLAAAMHKDLSTVTVAVGRALEGNTTALKRMGVEVEDGATKAETLANVMKVLEANAGAAALQTNTYEGAVAALSHAHENWQIALGDVFTKNQAVIGVLKEFAGITNDNTKGIEAMQRELKLWVADGIYYAAAAVAALIDALSQMYKIGLSAFEELMIPLKLLITGIEAASDAIHGKFSVAWQDMKTGAKAAFQDVSDAAKHNGLDTVVDGFGKIMDAADRGWHQIKSGAEVATNSFHNTHPPIQQMIADLTAAEAAGKKLAEELLKEDPAKHYQQQEKALKSALADHKITLDQFHAEEKKNLDQKYADDLADLDAYYATGKLKDEDYFNAVAALEEQSKIDHEVQANEQDVEDNKRRQATLQDVGKMFGNLASLQKTGNAELFEIGKQSAAAQALVDGAAAIMATWKNMGGFPYAVPFVAAQAVATGVQLATIESAHLATGIDSVPGTGFQDNFPAVLAPGERVVPAQTNQDLTQFLQSQGNQAGILQQISSQLRQLTQVMAGGQVIQIDGREVFAVIRNQLRAGKAFT